MFGFQSRTKKKNKIITNKDEELQNEMKNTKKKQK